MVIRKPKIALSVVVAAALVTSIVTAIDIPKIAVHASGPGKPDTVVRPVDGSYWEASAASATPEAQPPASTAVPLVTTPGTYDLTVPQKSVTPAALTSASREWYPVGSTGIELNVVPAPGGVQPAAFGGSAQLQVSVLDDATVHSYGMSGLALRVTRMDGSPVGTVSARVASNVTSATFGADYASRLRFTAVADPAAPAVVTDAAERPASTEAVALSATVVPVSAAKPGAGSVLLMSSVSPMGGAGNFTATSLKPSDSWEVSP